MSELRLDYQVNSKFPWIGATFLVLAAVALLFGGGYYLKLKEQVASWEVKAARSNDKISAHKTAEQATSSVELAQEVNNANEVLRQLSVPWEALFQAVESSGSEKVTLLALEPDVEKHQVKINGETKNFKALTRYLAQLQEQAVFGSVYLQSHQVQQQDPDKPVRFSLLATWREKS